MDSEWVLTFKVMDTNGNIIRNEVKKSFDESPLVGIKQKYISKCEMMGWKAPDYNVVLTIEKDNNKK